MPDIAAEQSATAKMNLPATASIGWRPAITMAGLYSAGMALAWSISTHSYYQIGELVIESLPVLVPLACFTLWWGRRTRLRVHRSTAIGLPGLAFMGVVAAMLLVFVRAAYSGPADWWMIGLIFLGMACVGTGEECAYRGVCLNALAQRYGVLYGVIGSSVLFGLLHLVNAIVMPIQAACF